MFGHQDDQPGQQDSTFISDQSIDGAMGGGDAAPAEPVAQQMAPAAPATQTFQPTDAAPAAPAVSAPVASDDDNSADAAVPDATGTNNLIDIKQQALTQLTPLVGHLDQSPEEKFRTTMMMIQASDDQSLIQSAFAAAQNITDEKTRAQALLDIVNEINYFTQGQHDDQA